MDILCTYKFVFADLARNEREERERAAAKTHAVTEASADYRCPAGVGTR